MILMLLALVSHIIFPANERRAEINVKRINRAVIESGWEVLTDTADLLIPRRFLMRDARVNRFQDILKKGDQVIIKLGVYDQLFEEFRGYVADINTEEPVHIRCEDEMWKLKQIQFNRNYKSVTFPQLVKDMVGNRYPIDVMDVDLGEIGFERMTVAQVLQEIKDRYHLYSYFKGDTLVCGKIHLDDTEEVRYDLQRNIEQHDLIFRKLEDLRIKVRAQSILSDGSTIEEVVGDEDGEESKLVYRNIRDRSVLKSHARRDLDRLKIEGYRGSLTAFGIPFARHGYTSEVIDKFFPDQSGKYYIDHMITDFSDTPEFRRKIKLGKRAAS